MARAKGSQPAGTREHLLKQITWLKKWVNKEKAKNKQLLLFNQWLVKELKAKTARQIIHRPENVIKFRKAA